MGFFDALGKIINGQPVFGDEANVQSTQQPAAPSEQHDVTRTNSGHKVVPDLKVSNLKTHRNGNSMRTRVWVQNLAAFEVELTRSTVMGQGMNQYERLQAGRGCEIEIYNGQVAKDNKNSRASIDYKIVQNGDYFQKEFDVEFNFESDGVYTLEELHPKNYVRDT